MVYGLLRKALGITLTLSFLIASQTVCQAKFSCDVESIQGNKLILTNCKKKGLKRLKAGDTVNITKKRKKAKIEGC
ncbi:hypothetical protein DBT_0796 [Dissulfuribacter thermophilus]|uniref:Uncharacterized protein n=1 Tax=Dissulfuribacter thermophilus TaxID=1156395 RepID=A0A1B9F7X8_9BACT|nr:hypothetical protein [Dissulfuribacter thermophilus]OCC15871.1 hypothetical protein DBT_0796 [Dissulfuribacter thermophilus]